MANFANISGAMSQLSRLLVGENVRWCVYAGAGSAFYGVNRKITDLDILVHPNDRQKLVDTLARQRISIAPGIKEFAGNGKSSLSGLKVSIAKTVINGSEVEFAFDVKVNDRWLFQGDKELFSKTRFFDVGGIKVPVASPEDIIVLKGILQRGKREGKFDIMDIVQITKTTPLDLDYLRKRASKGLAGARVMPLVTKIIKRIKYRNRMPSQRIKHSVALGARRKVF